MELSGTILILTLSELTPPGTVITSSPSLGVEESKRVSKLAPPSVDKNTETNFVSIGAISVCATSQVKICLVPASQSIPS